MKKGYNWYIYMKKLLIEMLKRHSNLNVFIKYN